MVFQFNFETAAGSTLLLVIWNLHTLVSLNEERYGQLIKNYDSMTSGILNMHHISKGWQFLSTSHGNMTLKMCLIGQYPKIGNSLTNAKSISNFD